MQNQCKTAYPRLLVLALFLLTAAGCGWTASQDAPAGAEISAAAEQFVQSLNADQREQATFPFDHSERQNWHYVPRDRKGLPLKAMDDEQRGAAHALLRSALSAQGYEKAFGIIELEEILRRLEDRPPDDTYRDSGKYYFTIFGEPGQEAWGWRVEGHHLSLNYSSATDELKAFTPAFWGANPATVPSGPHKGWQVLEREETLAHELISMLPAEGREQAILQENAYSDILTRPERSPSLEEFEGLPAADMSDEERTVLRSLIQTYVRNHRDDLARQQFEQVLNGSLEDIHFAWAGSTKPGDPYYYRIHGPNVLIELDNTQNNANHVHSVLRDPGNDFGVDILKQHYEQSDHH